MHPPSAARGMQCEQADFSLTNFRDQTLLVSIPVNSPPIASFLIIHHYPTLKSLVMEPRLKNNSTVQRWQSHTSAAKKTGKLPNNQQSVTQLSISCLTRSTTEEKIRLVRPREKLSLSGNAFLQSTQKLPLTTPDEHCQHDYLRFISIKSTLNTQDFAWLQRWILFERTYANTRHQHIIILNHIS